MDLEKNKKYAHGKDGLRAVRAEQRNLGEVQRWASAALLRVGVDEARRESELMVSHLIGASVGALYLRRDEPVSDEQFVQLKGWVERRGHREPLYYILGECEFWSLPFKVAPAVLIPRPETELLVEEGLGFLKTVQVENPLVLDLCTGSGCVAVSIARDFQAARVYGSDISENAVVLARENAALNDQERVEFFVGDLFEAVSDLSLKGRFDLIVSNPPYIPEGDIGGLQKEVATHEPRAALDGGADGLVIICRIVKDAPAFLKAGGKLILEVGFDQGGHVAAILQESGFFTDVKVRKDYSGIERIVSARRI
ncbi:Peptide chain release factor N(5)-glutamine methyltransferase [hydrothermal vent metagenome]|uniref:peptide chain release factor N(5)-glutamine methyltransferase n=1 Tax=hydrothermal vent metagenome TaxID=652676 RepID=A0A3B0R7F8_9ZZZZ